MIKNIIKSLIVIFLISSCANFNDKHVMVPIKSSPSGAAIYIDNKYFGQTPAKVKLIPDKNYEAKIVKKGYGSSNISLETWYSVRGGRGGDTARCVMDALGVMFVIPAFSFYSVKCRDFKKSEYLVNIGNNDYMSNTQNSNHNQHNRYKQDSYQSRSYKNQDYYNQNQNSRFLNKNDQEYEYVSPNQNIQKRSQYYQDERIKNYYGGESAGYYNQYYNE
ncbi:PEGA domain-containing protein [Rickettsiales bacterium]|nr:PEGA domain-containing protein [Rickettsiales bacterium]